MATRTRADKYRTTYYQDRSAAFQQYMVLAELGYDTEEAKYKAQMKVYDKQLAEARKEKERLRKLRDTLVSKQVSANEAAEKYIATQQNSVARAEFAASEAFRRTVYSANAAMARAMLFSGGKSPGMSSKWRKPELEDLAKKKHDENPDDVSAALASAKNAQQESTQTPKGQDDVDVLTFGVVDAALAREKQKPEYQGLTSEEADMLAEGSVFQKLTPQDKEAYQRGGNLIATGKADGYVAIATDKGTEVVPMGEGALKYFGYKPADYSKVIADVDKRLAGIPVPAAPTAPSRGDMKEKQRDLYFDALFPDDDPAYQLNRVMRNLSTMSDEELLADVERLVPGARGSNVPGQAVAPVTAPVVPAATTPTPVSSTGTIPPVRPTLEELELERENRNREAQRVINTLAPASVDEPFAITNPEAATPAMRAALLRGQAVEADQALKQVASNQADIEALSNDLAGGEGDMAVELTPKDQAKLDAARQATQDARLKSEAADDAFGTQVGRYRDFKAERELDEKAAAKEQKTTPISRGNEQTLDADLKKSFSAPENKKKNEDDLSFLEETPSDRDTRIRTETALAAQKDYDTGVALKKRETNVGKEVAALWTANKNKGTESLKDQLDYVARTYKKPDEQKLAAEVLYGLEYEQRRSTKLG